MIAVTTVVRWCARCGEAIPPGTAHHSDGKTVFTHLGCDQVDVTPESD